MKIAQQFTEIEVGEVDDFAFDVTTRVGTAQIVATEFTCLLTSFSGGADPNPPARIANPTSLSNSGLYYRAADGSLQFRQGFFAIARIGPMPASAAGGTYIIGYRAFLGDGRVIQDNTTLPCVLPGE